MCDWGRCPEKQALHLFLGASWVRAQDVYFHFHFQKGTNCDKEERSWETETLASSEFPFKSCIHFIVKFWRDFKTQLLGGLLSVQYMVKTQRSVLSTKNHDFKLGSSEYEARSLKNWRRKTVSFNKRT